MLKSAPFLVKALLRKGLKALQPLYVVCPLAVEWFIWWLVGFNGQAECFCWVCSVGWKGEPVQCTQRHPRQRYRKERPDRELRPGERWLPFACRHNGGAPNAAYQGCVMNRHCARRCWPSLNVRDPTVG